MNDLWKNMKQYTGLSKKPPARELAGSRYSLVSATDVTADTIQLWLGLPEEVKNDPAWAPLRQLYERQNGLDQQVSDLNDPEKTLKPRLPSVSSAPAIVTENEIELEDERTKKETQEEERKETVKFSEVPHTKLCSNNRAKFLVKMTILIGCWMFFTAAFLTFDEKKDITKNSAINSAEVKDFIIPVENNELSVEIKLAGPFLSKQAEMNSTYIETKHKMQVWIEKWTSAGGSKNLSDNSNFIESTSQWPIHLLDESKIDFSRGEVRSRTFRLESSQPNNETYYVLRMNATTNQTVPFTLSYTLDPLDASTGVIYAIVLLCALYILVIFEVIHRTMAAVVVSTLSLAVLAMVGERPTVPEVLSWLDTETLVLLFSMMVLVAIMAETGVFDFLAVYTFEVTKGKLWPLIFLLCGITAVLSTFLDNVTTVLLMSPVTIRLCEVMDLDPVPILMFMAIYSNIGGTATPVGDPPCVIIASNKAVVQSGINFTNFTAHMSLGIVLVFLQTSLQLRFMFRDTGRLRLNVPRDIQDLRNQISIWRRAAESLPHLSKDVHVVRERLERKVKKLTVQLEVLVKESHKRACPKEAYVATLNELKDKYKIRDRVLLIKASVAICFVVTLFFLHSIPEMNRVSLGWTALLGAILLLLLADREDLEPILHRVEWSTLLFFAALFVLMEALSKLGLILYVGMVMEKIIMQVNESSRLAVAIVIILWASGMISAFVDNIPLSTMMVRVVVAIGNNPALNLPLGPLIWALLFGSCLGGNGTLIGASANVVCAGVAEQHGYKFTFTRFFRVGFPIMVGHLIVSTGYLLMCHCVFTWH